MNLITEFLADAEYTLQKNKQNVCIHVALATEHALHTLLKTKAALYLNNHNVGHYLLEVLNFPKDKTAADEGI